MGCRRGEITVFKANLLAVALRVLRAFLTLTSDRLLDTRAEFPLHLLPRLTQGSTATARAARRGPQARSAVATLR